jgi:hypothetical protein
VQQQEGRRKQVRVTFGLMEKHSSRWRFWGLELSGEEEAGVTGLEG